MTVIPTVITDDGRGARAYDIYLRLLKDGVIFLRGVIDDDLAATVTAQLLFLENEAPERDFFMTPEQAKEWGVIDLIVEKNPHSAPAAR